MIQFDLGEKTMSLHSEWSELTENEYKLLCKRLRQFKDGEISISECRSLYLCDILGLDLSKIPRKKQWQAADNIYTLGRQLTFFTAIKYEEGKLAAVSPDLQRLANKIPPEDLPYSSEVAYLRKLRYDYEVDAVFFANLIPTIVIDGIKYHGYTATYVDGVLNTNITAKQYIDAVALLDKIALGDASKRIVLAALLYGDLTNTDPFKQLDDETLDAISFNFQSVIIFIFTKTEFALLWKSTVKQSKGSVALTPADMLYDLSAGGYGTPAEVENMPLLIYLRILKKNLISAVKMMRDMDKDEVEISKKTGLPLTLISKIE